MELYVPSRTCPCLRCKVNELMAPALLVTFGLLFFMNNVHVADFGRTWPLILIVIGAVRVLQSTASTAGHRPDGLAAAPAAEVAHE